MKPPRPLTGFPWPPQIEWITRSGPSRSPGQRHARMKNAMTKESVQLWGQGWPRPSTTSEHSEGSQDWCHQGHHQGQPRTLTGILGPSQSAPWHMQDAHFASSCSSIASLWGKCAREELTLKVNRTSSGSSLMVSDPVTWDPPSSPLVGC